ncbi:hypothetical protein ACFL4W_04145, partial [Planctomycetota bacterium]
MATINGKLISTKGKLADKEFEIDKIRGLALAAPGGGRVEIRFNRIQKTYNLVSQGYPVAVNGKKTEKQDINDGDIIVVGANEFRFLFPSAEAPK